MYMAEWISLQSHLQCTPEASFTSTTNYVQKLGESLRIVQKPVRAARAETSVEGLEEEYEDYDISLQDYGSESYGEENLVFSEEGSASEGEYETESGLETGEGDW
eukprot:TRINITY_DN9096_c0_g1_i1.p2 TRINITY_DN9096_c0_g1~~TRINITY_DN9096_c0_g1_i1.p2  ORF type:complete len:105 (+),score=31.60 TRINITY_DN9096_c0_g1_i1:78-392(+)